MKLKRLFAAVVCAAVVATTVVPVSAAVKAPQIAKVIDVQLFRETANSGNNKWWVDKATSLIPIRNLRWNAKIFGISASNSKAKAAKRAVGAFYLDICANKAVKPGDRVVISFFVKQNDELYKLSTTVRFKKAASPFASFLIGSSEGAAAFAGERTASYKVSPGEDLEPIKITAAAGQRITKIEVCFKDGKTRDMTKQLLAGKNVIITYIKSIKVTYQTIATPKYFKAENDNYAGAKRFPVTKYAVLNIV